jgi:predicted permease
MFRRLAALRVALRAAFLRTRVERELDEEIRYHLDREIEEARTAGMSPDDARSAAMRTMGAIEKSKEECRDVRRPALVAEAGADLRYAARALRRQPGFAALVIGIMTVGIGANTAVFTVVNAVLLKPLPYPNPDRIVTLSTWEFARGEINQLVTPANFRDWRDQSRSFDAMAVYRPGDAPVTANATAEYVRNATVDGSFFPVFGVDPALGRTITLEDIVRESRVAVISHAYWQNRFGGDAGVLGRTLRVGLNDFTIAGVMPPGFRFPFNTDLWRPLVTTSTSRSSHNLFAVGRLRSGVPLAGAQSELNTIAARLEQQYPDSNSKRGVIAKRLQDELVGDVRGTLYVLWGAVAVVLLIACANTATLLLGKATSRAREVAVRTALGASRARIVRQLITESLALALSAGVLGTLLAYWGARLLVSLTPAAIVRTSDTSVDPWVLAFTLFVTVVISVLVGLVPALHVSRVDLADAVKHGGTRSVIGGAVARTRGLLVGSQIALAVVLLTGAGLLVKSLMALHDVDLGFRPDNVLVARASGVRSAAENNMFFASVTARVAALPGVIAAGATSIPPGELSLAGSGAFFADRVPERRDRTTESRALFPIITPNAFAALGIPVKSGRDFNASDTAQSPLVVIVNEALARKAFGTDSPIGRSLICTFDRKEPMTIIGVVGDVRQRGPAIVPEPQCYMPYTQHAYNGSTLYMVIRTTGDPNGLAETVRRASSEISPEIPLAFTTTEALMARPVDTPRFRAVLFAVFAAVAVCLAMAGIYGLMAYAVQQRSQEIALRMALGAERRAVVRLILRRALVIALGGLVVGLAASSALTRLLATMLFEVKPFDPQVYLVVSILLSIVALLAGYLPARRAATLDPAEVLRAA